MTTPAPSYSAPSSSNATSTARHWSRSTPTGTLEKTMRKKKKRGTTLPRVTLMAYNRRDLLSFVEAVAKLEHIAADLQTVAAQLPKPRPKKLPPLSAASVSGVDQPSFPEMA